MVPALPICWILLTILVFNEIKQYLVTVDQTQREPPVLKSKANLKPAVFLMTYRGRHHWLQKEVRLIRSLRENDPSSHWIYQPQ